MKRYETVVLREAIGGFRKGELGAVVEVYTTPFEAYDVEIVADDGTTRGLLEAVRPSQIEAADAAARRIAPSLADAGR